MKKSLLALATALAVVSTAHADVVTVKFSELGYTNAAEINSIDLNSYINISLAKGSNTNAPKYYTTGSAIRFYGGNTMTVSVKGEFEITDISFTTGTGSYVWNSESTSSPAGFNPSTNTWKGNSNSVTLTQGGSTGHVRLESITVTYAPLAEDAVLAPIITQVNGESTATFTLESATEGASIYYTLNGNEPTEESALYTEPVEFTGSVLVKAVAYKDGKYSNVASSTLTAPAYLYSLKEILELESGVSLVLHADMTAIYQNGANLYITDGESNMLVYGGNTTYAPGQKFSKLTGKYSPYNNQPEVTGATLVEAEGEGVIPEPKKVLLKDLTSDNVLEYVIIKNADLTNINGKRASLTQDGTDFQLYNTFNLEWAEDSNLDVTGFVTQNFNNVQISPVSIEKNNDNTGVNTIAADTVATYYNLQGVKVANPEKGMYIVVKGNKATKVTF